MLSAYDMHIDIMILCMYAYIIHLMALNPRLLCTLEALMGSCMWLMQSYMQTMLMQVNNELTIRYAGHPDVLKYAMLVMYLLAL